MKKFRKKRSRRTQQLKSHIFLRGIIVLLAFFATMMWLSEEKETIFMREDTKEQFISKISGKAQSLYAEYGVLPSISISQAILESNWGKSGLAQKNQNYYGIKARKNEGALFETQEYIEETDEWIEIDAPFRIYDSWEGSMEDHARLLAYGTDWNRSLYRGVIEAQNYQEAAYALHRAGYATDPQYPEKLIRLIEQYNLQQYDTVKFE